MNALSTEQRNKLDLLYCDYNENKITFEQYESKKLLSDFFKALR